MRLCCQDISWGDDALWRPKGGTAGEGSPSRRRGQAGTLVPGVRAHCPDAERGGRGSRGVCLHPLAEATGVASGADGGEGPARVAQRLP